MTNHLESTKTWQAWLARLESLLRVELWEQFMARVGDENEMNLQRWAAMYTILLQTALSSAMLLACWEEPAEEVESTLEDIARRVGAMRFEKARRGMDRQLRDLYVESTKRLMRDLPSEADVLRAIFVAYVRDDYDSGKDANLLMREAQSLAAMRQREAALAAVGRAGAAGLRGSSIWPGWADEGSPEFCHWALVLTGALESYAPQLPFGPVAEERLHAEQRAQELKPLPFPQTNVEIETGEGEDEVEDEDENESLSPTPEFITEWMNIAQREQPLSPEEIVELGDRYDMYVEMAIRSLEMRDFLPLDMSATGLLSLTATVLGILRCSDEHVIDLLMELIVKEDELAEDGDDDAPDAAIWALQQIGQPALQPIFDFVRYSSLEAARTSMLQVLGAVGRGSPEVYDYLAGQFTQTSWADDKSRYALPLALLHDPRAVPLFVEALKAPGVTEPIAWELLDALQELEVTFYINHDTRAVNIPDYGVIEDVLPSEWMSRAEIAQQEADVDKDLDEWEELDDEDEWDDEDDLGEDETDTYDDEVVYDAEGIPRCPDCGAEMHYIAGRWVHPPDVEPPAVKPIRTQHIGRNDPCPCGSGKKYKNCHGRGV